MPMILPASPESEIAAIGCCLIGGLDTTAEAVEALRGKMFTHPGCEEAFGVLEAMVTEGQAVNTHSFAQAWARTHGNRPVHLDILVAPDKTPSAAALSFFTDAILDAYKRRQLVYAGERLQATAADPTKTVDEVIADAEAAIAGDKLASVDLVGSTECSNQLVDYLQHRFDLQGKRSGLATGFNRFDDMTDGLQPGEQTIIAARPSMGKTAIGLNIVEQVCLRNGWPTLVVTLEMSIKALMRRLLSSHESIPMGTLRDGTLNEDTKKRFTRFTGLLKKKPLYVVEGVSGMDCNRLSASVRRAVRKHGIKLVVIDYLQKIRPSQKQEKRTYEIGEVSGVLKALAVQTGVALLTLAQLNRESEKDKGRLPRVSDLADSGQIERDADTIALLHRDRSSNDGGRLAKLIIGKQRDGEVGSIDLSFDGQFCKFSNAIRVAQP